MQKSTLIVSLLIVLSVVPALLAQTAPARPSDDWIRIRSSKGDFSVALPSMDFLIDRDEGRTTIYYFQKDTEVIIQMDRNKSAKAAYKELLAHPASQDPLVKGFTEGDFFGRWFGKTSEKTGGTSYFFQMASSEGSYEIRTSASSNDTSFVDRFLRSMRLGTVQLVSPQVVDKTEQDSSSIDDLKVSDEIIKALAQPKSSQEKLEADTSGKVKEDDLSLPAGVQYSRPLVILRRPPPPTTIPGGGYGAEGTVKLKVVLLADGTVGPITILKSLNGTRDRQAFDAAKKIKFLPAQINGKAVDVTWIYEYNFHINWALILRKATDAETL